MELWLGALNLGLLYAFMTVGVFITFRIHDFPDITADGSLTTGAAVAAVLLASGFNPLVALIAAFAAGAVAGSLTAFIHTRFAINGLLSGILVMTGLYSVNLHIMGRSNIPLLRETTFFTHLKWINPGLPAEVWTCAVLSAAVTLFWLLISIFFKTDLGIVMRSTGNNAAMAAASGVNVERIKIFGVAFANGLVALSGALVAQYQGFADIGMGIGTVVTGLAAVIIGESILKMRSIHAQILSVVLGSVIFRLMIALALYIGLDPIDLKLLTAGFVLATLIASRALDKKEGGGASRLGPLFGALFSNRRIRRVAAGLAIAGVAAAAFGYSRYGSGPEGAGTARVHKIGVVQVDDSGPIMDARNGFLKEMERLGYKSGRNVSFDLQSAHGDLPTVRSIIDKFVQQGVDIVVPLSTGCAQAAIHKIKDRPIVFAIVANPFLIEAGKSEADHLPNVTGVYGTSPQDKLMKLVRRIRPGRITIGSMWNPAFANAEYAMTMLRSLVKSYDGEVTLQAAAVTNTSEVYQAALTLAQNGIDAFFLVGDLTTYSSFDSIVKVAKAKGIPIFMGDVERLRDGGLCALGYDFASCGAQAARMVDRIFKGESPKDIPFEKYKTLTTAVNLQVARELGIQIPQDVLDEATVVIREGE